MIYYSRQRRIEVYNLILTIESLTLLLKKIDTYFQELISYKIDLLKLNSLLQLILEISTIKYI